jgi:hypothetical protein
MIVSLRCSTAVAISRRRSRPRGAVPPQDCNEARPNFAQTCRQAMTGWLEGEGRAYDKSSGWKLAERIVSRGQAVCANKS